MASIDELRLRVNDDRRRRFGDRGRILALVCECGDPDCHRTVLLSPEEYDARRPGLILHSEHVGFVPGEVDVSSAAVERLLPDREGMTLEGFPLLEVPLSPSGTGLTASGGNRRRGA